MAAITAAMVKELREMTDAGMMECKKALVEADGDMDKAVDVLRTRGLAAAAKKVGRATNEGTVMAIVSDDATKGAVVELNCETDFVGMNEKFKGYAEKIARAAMAANVEDIEALKAVDAEGETVEDVLTDAIHTLGENMNLARAAVVEAGGVASYIHGGGKIGVLVEFKLGDAALATNDDFKKYGRDIAMQVAAVIPLQRFRQIGCGRGRSDYKRIVFAGPLGNIAHLAAARIERLRIGIPLQRRGLKNAEGIDEPIAQDTDDADQQQRADDSQKPFFTTQAGSPQTFS